MYYTVHHKHAASTTAYLKLQAVLSQVTRLEPAKKICHIMLTFYHIQISKFIGIARPNR